MPGPEQTKTPHEMIFGKKDSSFSVKRLVPYGQLAEVKLPKRQRKFREKSTPMVMVGYADDHASDCYKFYNPKTKKIVMSRDISSWYSLDDARRMQLSFYDPKRLATKKTTDTPTDEDEKTTS